VRAGKVFLDLGAEGPRNACNTFRLEPGVSVCRAEYPGVERITVAAAQLPGESDLEWNGQSVVLKLEEDGDIRQGIEILMSYQQTPK